MHDAFPTLSPMALRHRLQGEPTLTLLDVRSPAEYRSGHIPGARLAPLDELAGSKLAALTDGAGLRADNPLYLTCHAGLRATQAAQVLDRAGLKHLMLVQGGTQAWQNAGLPMQRHGSEPSLPRQPQIAPGALPARA